MGGALYGGVEAWRDSGRELASLPQMSVDELRGSIAGLQILDVRRRAEYDSGHVPGAVNIPLDVFDERVEAIDLARPTAIICASGYRSSTAASLLERRMHPPPINVAGGTTAWMAAGYEAE